MDVGRSDICGFVRLERLPAGRQREVAARWRWLRARGYDGKRGYFVGTRTAAGLLGSTRQCIDSLVFRRKVFSLYLWSNRLIDVASLEEYAQTPRLQKGGRPPVRGWTAEEERLLGSVADAELAVKLGRSVGDVAVRRRSLGIRVAGWRGPVWDRANEALLGTMADSEVARRIGISRKSVASRRRKLGIAAYRDAKHANWVRGGKRVKGFFRWHG